MFLFPAVIFLRAVDLSIEKPAGAHRTMGGPLLNAPEMNKHSLNLPRPNTTLKIGPFPPVKPKDKIKLQKVRMLSKNIYKTHYKLKLTR
jgi:hypothetical protein